jgi:hypothetical protein
MYPLPPTDLDASDFNGVRISWLPPTYTERKWPYAESNPTLDDKGWPMTDGEGKELGETIYAREVKAYHILRSTNLGGGWIEVGSVEAQYDYTYAEDADLFMLHPIVDGFKVDQSNKLYFIDHPSNGTYYYAITTEEHSGIESRQLSEIIQVEVSGGSVISASIAAIQGQKDFWRKAPSAPSSFNFESNGPAGHYLLTWEEPDDPKIRYYNIYYSSTSIPPAEQAYRIASVPKGSNTYLDWLAEGNAYYRITSVDRQGNEGLEVFENHRPDNEQNPRLEAIEE